MMATLDELKVVISADIAQLETSMAKAEASLTRVATVAEASSGRYRDSVGRLHEANGRFSSSAQIAEQAAKNVGGGLDTIGGAAGVAGSSLGRLTSINSSLAASFLEADKQRDTLEKGFGRLGESVKTVGEGLTVSVSAPIALLGAAALKIGGDFESAFNRVQAATQASGAELASLREKAQNIALDPNLKFSSVEAAQALENLAKNGLDTAEILGGAADASTNLATATGGTLATAADITTDVMKNFGKSAAEAAGLVSNITGATVASKFSIDDYKLALGQAGAVAGQLGVSFTDFNTALSVTSSGFSSGSDAGTSFKTFLQRLVPQSKEAEQSIQKLGLNFFDTQGKMLPLRDIAGQLQQAFKGLSDQAKNTEGTKIFGSDSIRTALLLAKDGVEGFDKMAASIGKVNAASQGAILSQGFVGSYEAFKSSLEGLGQAIADAGILEFATGLAKRAGEVASSLAQADPELLRFGVGIAAAAAAVGPLLVAIGSLGVAIPAVASGFALLSGPVGIAALAVAGLAAGVIALVAANTDTAESVGSVTRRLGEQKAAVQTLQGTYTPLLDRYDELKAKSTLTKAEQEELRSIIEKVGQQIPTTITQFDAYGKALDINSQSARQFIQRQQEIAEQANKVELTKQREEFRKLQIQIANTIGELNKLDEAGNHVKFIASGDDEGGQYFSLTAKEITALQEKLAGLQKSSRGVGGLIDQLKGIPPPLKEASDAADKTGKALTGLASGGAAEGTDAMAKALAKLRGELAVNAGLSEALGTDYDTLGERQKVLEGGVKSLIAAGWEPSSATVKAYSAALKQLNTDLGDNQQISAKGIKGIGTKEKPSKEQAFDSGLEKNLPTELASPILPDYNKIFADAYRDVVAGYGQLNQAEQDFNTNTETLLDSFPLAAFEGIGNGIADGIASGIGPLKGATAGLLEVLADYLRKFAKFLVVRGLGDIASGNIIQGAAEIAAGGLVYAGAGFISAGAASLTSGAGAGASSGGIASKPSSATTPTPDRREETRTTVTHVIELRARGADLVAVHQLETYRRLRTG